MDWKDIANTAVSCKVAKFRPMSETPRAEFDMVKQHAASVLGAYSSHARLIFLLEGKTACSDFRSTSRNTANSAAGNLQMHL